MASYERAQQATSKTLKQFFYYSNSFRVTFFLNDEPKSRKQKLGTSLKMGVR